MQFGFGYILRHTETGEYRYFHPHRNTNVLQNPHVMSDPRDLVTFLTKLRSLNLEDILKKDRADTKWQVVMITNVVFTVTEMDYLLGEGSIRLPEHLKRTRSIIGLTTHPRTGRVYDDAKCFFRCLALHLNADDLDREADILLKRWNQHRENNDFQGVSLTDIPLLEELFKLNIQIYDLQADGTTQNVYNSCFHHAEKEDPHPTLYLNAYESHFSYISNITGYSKKFQCVKCEKHFPRSDTFERHVDKCKGMASFKFPGGFYVPQSTIFEELKAVNIHVPEDDSFYPWFGVFDFEAMLKPSTADGNTAKLKWTAEHIPISFSICSNVDGFETASCTINEDVDALVENLVLKLTEIGTQAYELAQEKWKDAINSLEELIEEARVEVDDEAEAYAEAIDAMEEVVTVNDVDDTDDDDVDAQIQFERPQRGEEKDEVKERKTWLQQLSRLKVKLDSYCRQLPVLGFNSARYDLNLVKQKIAKHLGLHEEEHCFIVKKNNAYMCISSEDLKFLDASQFLAPGCSYDNFLKCFQCDVRKGFFPYEWLDSPDKLKVSSLPPVEAFWSELKGHNVLEEERLRYDKLRDAGHSESDVLKKMMITSVPPTKQERYASLKELWKSENMKTFCDYLEWYNNLDVQPFVVAVERMMAFYIDRGIDLLKTCISVPSAARSMIFKSAALRQVHFALFSNQDKDLYQKISSNIVGGPSIQFRRKAKVNETRIREGGKPCQKIVGFDANALYLWAIGQPMPVGSYIRRRDTDNFRPHKRDRWEMMFNYMDWLNQSEGLQIKHFQNSSREKRVGQYYVDGYEENTNTVYEYYGCYWHSHTCQPKYQETEKGKACYQRTLKRAAYIRKKGYNLVEKWECEFLRETRSNKALKSFIHDRKPVFFNKVGYRDITEQDILKAVRQDQFFGMVECDLEVPTQWQGTTRPQTNLSPEEFFSEMSPLFCTAEIPFEKIGKHMQEHARSHGLSEKPRKLLVGGMKGKKLLIASPLLKWYLEKGIVVTKIYEAIEFHEDRCFQTFMHDVTNARRQGDRDCKLDIIASTMKLIGNR